MVKENEERSTALLFLISVCGALCLRFLDRYFFHLGFSFYHRPEFSFWYIVGHDFFVFWPRILRLIFAFAGGFLLYFVLHRNKPFLLLTWVLWQVGIYVSYLIIYEKPFWFIEDPINFFWRMLTILPVFLGAALSEHLSGLQRILSSNVAKFVVIAFSVVTIVLSMSPFIRIVTSGEYRAAREFEVEIPSGAKSVRRHWNPFFGKRTIEFTIEMVNPDSLVQYYDQTLNWQIMPIFAYQTELGWGFTPGSEWEWIKVPPERETQTTLRGFGSQTWVDVELNIDLTIHIISKREDPQKLFEVRLVSKPSYYKDLMRRSQGKRLKLDKKTEVFD